MSSHLVFTTAPFNIDDILLGTFVPDVRYPNQDSLPPKRSLLPNESSKRPQTNFKGALGAERNTSFRAQLTKLLTLSAEKRRSENFKLQAERGWIYELRQPKALFKEFCKRKEVRTLLKGGLEAEQDSYFVVGFRSFENAAVGRGARAARGFEAGASVPVGQIVQANTGANPGDAADAAVAFEHAREETEEESFETEGELIYAIEYRKILMNKRHENAPPALETDNVWRYYCDTRGTRLPGGEVESEEYEEYEGDLGDEDVMQMDDSVEKVEDIDGETLLVPVKA